MANDTLKRIGEFVCTDCLGFAPTSNATKPPHIANGYSVHALEKSVKRRMFMSGLFVKERRMQFHRNES